MKGNGRTRKGTLRKGSEGLVESGRRDDLRGQCAQGRVRNHVREQREGKEDVQHGGGRKGLLRDLLASSFQMTRGRGTVKDGTVKDVEFFT